MIPEMYKLSHTFNSFAHRQLSKNWLLFDAEDNSYIDAHVHSGDYFSTLATQLDALTEKLPPDSDEVMSLERYVRDLLYIDTRYKIVAKKVSTDYEH